MERGQPRFIWGVIREGVSHAEYHISIAKRRIIRVQFHVTFHVVNHGDATHTARDNAEA
jgi:hypothetical protein